MTDDPEESSPEEFAEAVGNAIMMWQQVEAASAHAFMHLLAARNVAAMSVFYYIKNFSTRSEMMNIAARFYFHGRRSTKLAREWEALAPRMNAGASLRNRIAHYEVAESIGKNDWKFTLGPPPFDWSQLDPTNPQRWKVRQSARVVTFSQVAKAADTFRALGNDLNDFALRVGRLNLRKEPLALGAKQLPHALASDSGHLVLTAHRPPGAKPIRIPKNLRKKR